MVGEARASRLARHADAELVADLRRRGEQHAPARRRARGGRGRRPPRTGRSPRRSRPRPAALRAAPSGKRPRPRPARARARDGARPRPGASGSRRSTPRTSRRCASSVHGVRSGPVETWTVPSALRVRGPTMASSGRAARRSARVSTAPAMTSASGFRNRTRPARPARQPRLQAAAKPCVLRVREDLHLRVLGAHGVDGAVAARVVDDRDLDRQADVAGEGSETGAERRAGLVGDDDDVDARMAAVVRQGRAHGRATSRERVARAARPCSPRSGERRAPARRGAAARRARRRSARECERAGDARLVPRVDEQGRLARRSRRAQGAGSTTSGTPRAAASSAGRPKPSYSERKTATSAAA